MQMQIFVHTCVCVYTLFFFFYLVVFMHNIGNARPRQSVRTGAGNPLPYEKLRAHINVGCLRGCLSDSTICMLQLSAMIYCLNQ